MLFNIKLLDLFCGRDLLRGLARLNGRHRENDGQDEDRPGAGIANCLELMILPQTTTTIHLGSPTWLELVVLTNAK